jgi:uncharacterized membrane protein
MTRQSGVTGRWERTAGQQRPPTLTRLAVSAAAGILAAVLTITLGSWRYAPAIGWDGVAIVFSGWVWAVIWPLSAEDTARDATAQDPNRAISDLLVLSASIASLAAVGMVLIAAHTARPPAQGLLAILGLITVAVSWFTVHTVFTLRYALLYYQHPAGGIDFNQQEPPNYQDFAYVALTLGMTFQVSDTSLQSSAIRSTALRHALMSYLFGAVILAASINLVAGLGSSGGLGL